MNFTNDNKNWLELMNFVSNMDWKSFDPSAIGERIVKFRPADTEGLSDKAKKFKKLFA